MIYLLTSIFHFTARPHATHVNHSGHLSQQLPYRKTFCRENTEKTFTCDPLKRWTFSLSFEQMADNRNLEESIFPLLLDTEAFQPHSVTRHLKYIYFTSIHLNVTVVINPL